MRFQRSIFWLRRDLRLEDNVALSAATRFSKEVVLVFVFDTNILDRLQDKNDRRMTVIHNALLELDQKVRKKGSALVLLLESSSIVYNAVDLVFIQGIEFQRDNYLLRSFAGNINISFEGVNGDALLLNMDDIAVSNGAACSSAVKEPSYVLKAIGRTEKLAEASLRIGIGRDTTDDNIDYAVDKICSVVSNLREIESLKTDLV